MNIKLLFPAVLLLLVFLTLHTEAQTYKSVKEVSGLPVGAEVKNFKAIDQFGKKFKLSKALKQGPVIIVFYRGQWCPVCNKHLSELQDSLSLLQAAGATVVAVSPEKPEYLNKMAAKTKASFTLLYDKDYKIGNAFDVIFQPEKKVIDLYNTRLDAKLEESHSDNSGRLPVPATFIIDRNNKVHWRQFNPDYKFRASVKDLLENLPKKSTGQ